MSLVVTKQVRMDLGLGDITRTGTEPFNISGSSNSAEYMNSKISVASLSVAEDKESTVRS